MIRPFTCVCMVLAAGSGLYLYQTKHRSQLLDREIQRVMKQTDVVRERSGMLRGEWALLSEPERLTELSRQHLALRPLAPTQFVAVADLGARLPPPLPAGSFAPPQDEVVDLPPLAAAKLAQPVPAAAPAKPAATAPVQVAQAPAAPAQAPAPKPVQVAALPIPATPTPTPAPAPATRAAKPAKPADAVAAPVAPPAPRAAPVVTASAAPLGLAAPPPGSIGESVARVARGLPPLPYRQEGAPATMALASSIAATPIGGAPAYAAPAMGAPVFSALGGTRAALPAPVPYGTAR